MGIHDKDLLTGKDKIETAIERIRFNCKGKKVLCAFSGGKDSQCCYHLLKESGIDFHAEYSITRFEPPDLMDFIRANYPDVTFRRAYKHTLFDSIKRHGLPNRFFRYCCDAKHVKTKGFDIAVIGVRAAESYRRAANWRTFGRKQDGSYYVCPIFDWTDDDVWEYLNERGIPHCRLYDIGYKRIGCVLCPLSMKNHDLDMKLFPKTVAVIRNAFYAYYERMKENGFKSIRGKVIRYLVDTPKEVLFDNWVRGGMHVQRLSDTRSAEGDEPCLFAGTGFSESDGAANQNDELEDRGEC